MVRDTETKTEPHKDRIQNEGKQRDSERTETK